MASQGSPPPLPQRTSPPVAKSGEQDPNVAKLYGVGGACAALALGIALSSFKMFIGLLLGVALAVVGGYGALYYLLNIAEAKAVEERKEEVKKKGEQPQLETNVRGSEELPAAPIWPFVASCVHVARCD